MRFILPAVFAATALAAPSSLWGPPGRGGPWGHGGRGAGDCNKALYFLDDGPLGAPSSIIAMTIGEDGKVSDPVRTSTNGTGQVSVDATGAPSLEDPMNSQNSILVSGNYIFTVNTGSRTAVMFKIDPEDPKHPTLVGSPVTTIGEFPDSVDYSEKLNLLCVLNGGAKDGVACFHVDAETGLSPATGLFSLRQALNETTPPSAPPLSASQILFTPDSEQILVTTKGAPTMPVTPSWFVTFPVVNGVVANKPVFNPFTELPLNFGGVFLPDGHTFFSAEASEGAAFLDVASNGTVTLVGQTKVATNGAICWQVYDEALNAGYMPDAATNYLTKINVQDYTVEDQLLLTTSNATGRGPGSYDVILQDNLLYALGGEPGIVVVDLEKFEQIQWYDLNYFGNRQGWTGLQAWPVKN